MSQSSILQSKSILNIPEVMDLQLKLKEITIEMEQYAKDGKYILAENCKVNFQKLKKELDTKKITQVQKKQKKENKDVKRYLRDQLQEFNQEWEMRLQKYDQEGKKIMTELKQRQLKEMQEAKQRLEEEIPSKCKDSSQCLNLKKIQQELAKQQSFMQAHKVQKLVREMEIKQQEAWNRLREDKISTGLDQLKQKQQIQLRGCEKRISTGKWELQMEKSKCQAKLVLKHSNVTKEFESQNKKQFLATKGELKSRIDVLSPTKSRILSPNSRSQLLLSMTR